MTKHTAIKDISEMLDKYFASDTNNKKNQIAIKLFIIQVIKTIK